MSEFSEIDLPTVSEEGLHAELTERIIGCAIEVHRHLGAGLLRVDLLVAESVVVEVKSVERVDPVFHAQVLTYLRATGKRVGLLVNFNTRFLRDGVKRFVL